MSFEQELNKAMEKVEYKESLPDGNELKYKMIAYIERVFEIVEQDEYINRTGADKSSWVKDLLLLDFTDNRKKIIESTDKMLDNNSDVLKAERDFFDTYGHYPQNGELDGFTELCDYSATKGKLESFARKSARELGLAINVVKVER